MRTSTKQDAATTMDGKFIKVVGDHLTFTNAKGQEHSFAVSKDVKVTSEGKEIKASELKAGSTIRMTMCEDDDKKILAIDSGKHIEAISKE